MTSTLTSLFGEMRSNPPDKGGDSRRCLQYNDEKFVTTPDEGFDQTNVHKELRDIEFALDGLFDSPPSAKMRARVARLMSRKKILQQQLPSG